MSKTLILGANGTVGSEIVRLLKAKSTSVLRATSQKKQERDQVCLNLVTQEGLDSALNGINKLFLLSPPGHVNQDELLIPVIEQAKKSGAQKIVLMTAMGANAIETAPFRKVEIFLEKSGIDFNIIRPNWFMQNFNSYWIEGILKTRQILLPVGNAKGSFIDARDIASVAVELLQSDRFDNQEFDLTGSEALDHHQVAKILSEMTGLKISYKEIPPQEMFQGLLAAGLPKPYSEFLLMILEFFKLGYAERTTDAVEKITGKKPISFTQYATDFKSAWK
jgi:uncharacterized protein YbjT (DUF2867 family)